LSPTTGFALRVHLFGQLRLAVDGESFAFPALRRTLPLLVYLLLRRNSATPRDQLAFAMWPDDDEDAARGQLRVNLHALQRSLPKAETGYWIRSDAEGVQWNPDAPLWLDVEEFERLAADPQRRE
jgi:DNA-binding SARP family transcriptional activator